MYITTVEPRLNVAGVQIVERGVRMVGSELNRTPAWNRLTKDQGMGQVSLYRGSFPYILLKLGQRILFVV